MKIALQVPVSWVTSLHLSIPQTGFLGSALHPGEDNMASGVGAHFNHKWVCACVCVCVQIYSMYMYRCIWSPVQH